MKKELFTLPARDHFLSRKEWIEACWRKISKSEKLFGSLVTPYERRNIVMRAVVMESVDQGKGVRQIARDLQISLQTINSVKKASSENNYRSYWERSKTERKKKMYSSNPTKVKNRPSGHPRRTKYGTVYIP